MPPSTEFKAFPKIPRLFRDVVVTEKIDGTNAAVVVTEDGDVFAQSRKRFISPELDNFGFAQWVRDHEDELRELGVGYHYGEWYGRGIQRGYGLEDRRFALFNPDRYEDRPECCEVVPVLWRGTFDQALITQTLQVLGQYGSQMVPGFMKPEGIVVYHAASRQVFKVLLENDNRPKSVAA
jgi:RNA ligase-like protein